MNAIYSLFNRILSYLTSYVVRQVVAFFSSIHKEASSFYYIAKIQEPTISLNET